VGELRGEFDEARSQAPTLASGLMALPQDPAEPLHLIVDGKDGGVRIEEMLEPLPLRESEPIGPLTQSSEEPSVLLDLWSDLAEQLQEVVLDDADDMEAISHDFGVGKIPSDEGSVRGTQINTDDPDFLAAL